MTYCEHNKFTKSILLNFFASLSLLYMGVMYSFTPCFGQSKKALLIGLSEYPVCEYDSKSTWGKIHGTNDILMLEKTLKKQGFEITKLTNRNATASKIRKHFKNLLQIVRSGDIVYVHFSGHGQPVEDLSGDETDGWDEAIVPYDAMKVYCKGKYEGKCHILDDELNIEIEEIRTKIGSKGVVYFVIDACHSGSSYRSEEDDLAFVRGSMLGFSIKGKEYIPKIDKRSKIKISKIAGKADVCLIEACRAYQTNCEIKESGKYYGPLSFYINMVLSDVQLGTNMNWTDNVRSLMDKDNRLIRQNIVIEASK